MSELAEINEHTRAAYNLAAARYHALFKDELDQKAYDRAVLDDFSSRLAPGSHVLDLGCGPSGHIGRYLHERGLRVVGVDLSERCVEIAAGCNPDMEFRKMDITDLEVPERSVDGLVSYYSIIHVPKMHVEGILAGFLRALRDGGMLLVVVKEGDQEGYQEEFLGYQAPIYFTLFTEDEIESALLGAGFRVLYLKSRDPLEEEIAVRRIYALGERPSAG